MLGERMRERYTSRAFKWTMLAVTVLGIVYFALFLGFVSFGEAVRIASVTSAAPLAIGVVVIMLGLSVHRAGYVLFGASLMIFGLANLTLKVWPKDALSWHVWRGLVIASAVVCVLSLAIQSRGISTK